MRAQPDGHGTYVWSDGSSYTGTWMRGHRHGVGSYQWASGASYMVRAPRAMSRRQHNPLTLLSSAQHPRKSRWYVLRCRAVQGEWRENHMHGVGTLEGAHTAHTPMEGMPKRHVARYQVGLAGCEGRAPRGGHGRRGRSPPHPPGASCAQGGWNKGVKCGLGKQLFANGDVYEGVWKAGVPHGPGR